ncbi:MAG: BsuPI-related putative proteinase inhibitor [Burkholderiales bacterium]
MAASDFETRLVLKNTAGKESVEFRGRESITFAVTIRNRSDAARTLTLPSSQTYDCIVYSGKDREVWRWSAGRMFTQAITELSLAPGESRSFTLTWNQTDRKGAPLPAGDYRVVGLVPGRAPGLRSGTVAFTLRPPEAKPPRTK